MPVTFEIHPTIGIARLGASDGFFIGPEPDAPPPASYRDAGGILRQAARFRVFRVERRSDGTVVNATEVTTATADITWTVHVANRKATGMGMSTPPARRNHATGIDQTDKALIIDPGPRTVSAASPRATFDGGSFRGTPVALGEARFETSSGRLVVLGGKGQSGFVKPGDAKLGDFADNDGWFDDTSEGPVTATMTLKKTGEAPVVSGARVVVAPPDFAPEIQNLVTVYDIVYQMSIDTGLLPKPTSFSFMRFVEPILRRASGYQWVNAAAAMRHGAPPFDFAASLGLFADPDQSVGLRPMVFRPLRDPRTTVNPPVAMPRLFDEAGYAKDQFRAMALTPVQYDALARWATVPKTPPDFVWDSPDDPWARQSLPEALDRVALEACAGGPFFPGIEIPRFIGDPKNYEPTLPVRLREDLPAGIVNSSSAVPWQADFNDCRWEGARDDKTGIEAFGSEDDYGWWPAQRPDSVFTDKARQHRVPWAAGISSGAGLSSRAEMVAGWKSLGFVLKSTDADGKTIYIQAPVVAPGKKPSKKRPVKTRRLAKRPVKKKAAKSKVPKSKVPKSKVPKSKVPKSKVPKSKAPKSKPVRKTRRR